MNLKEIFELMETFDKSSLSEIEVKIADTSVCLKKASATPVSQTYTGSPYFMPPQGSALPGPAPVAGAGAEAVQTKPGVEIITSPIVGTFYRAAAPDTPAFSEVGSKVDSGAPLCIIEAMKVMNKLEAEFKLEVLNILVENGQMVEFGTPLFEVKRL